MGGGRQCCRQYWLFYALVSESPFLLLTYVQDAPSHVLINVSLRYFCDDAGSACVVTFRGPFRNVGNGYFASWFTVVMSVKVAVLEWRTRNQLSGGSEN